MDSATIGARVRALRERAGVQSQELAARLDIDPSAMSNIERGKRALKTEELALIAEALKVSPLAILDEDSLLARLPVAPRAESGVVIDSSAFDRLTALTELHELLAEEGIPAQPRLGDVPDVDETKWMASATELAAWANKQLDVAAEGEDRFSALVAAIEGRFGVDVLVEEHPSDHLAGASITDRTFPLIFVNATQPTARSLFTLAHELAHVLSGQGEVLTLDVDLTAHTDRERFANAFAACLLMPEEDIRSEIQRSGRTAECLARMVDKFGVSFESLVYRLHNLGLINAKGRDQMRALGWRGVLAAVGDEEKTRTLLGRLGTRPEQRPPEWLTVRAFAGYRQGVVSVRPLAGLLDIDPDDLLARLAIMEKDATEVLEEDYQEQADQVSDVDRFSGNPV